MGKFTEYGAISEVADEDILLMVDVSDTTQSAQGSTKKATAAQANRVASSETVTVGAGGDYSTINDALSYFSKKKNNGETLATITLLSGFVMAEQVIADGVDLSWVEIESIDAVVSIDGSAVETNTIIVDSFAARYAFAADNGGKLPIIGALFEFDGSGTAANRMGIAMSRGGYVLVRTGCGVKSAPQDGIRMEKSLAVVRGADFSGAAGYGAYLFALSEMDATDANFSGAGADGVIATRASRADLSSADLSGCAVNGLLATQGSVVNAGMINASLCGGAGIRARGASVVSANSADVSGCFDGVYADRLSTISVDDDTTAFDASGCTRYGLFVRGGSKVFGGNVNANNSRMFVEQMGELSCPSMSSTGARNAAPALSVATGGIVSVPGSTIINSGTGAAPAIKCDAGQVQAEGSTIESASQIAMHSLDGGIINACKSTVTSSAREPIFAQGGDVIARASTFNVVSSMLIDTLDGGKIDIASATVNRSGTAPATSIRLRDGAHVNASGVTGEGANVTPNTITASGILIQ